MLITNVVFAYLPGKNSKSVAGQCRIKVDQRREHVEEIARGEILIQLFSCAVGYAALEFVEEPLRCPEGSRAVESANIGFLNAATPQT